MVSVEATEEEGEVQVGGAVQACADIVVAATGIDGREVMRIDESMKSGGVDEEERGADEEERGADERRMAGL